MTDNIKAELLGAALIVLFFSVLTIITLTLDPVLLAYLFDPLWRHRFII